MKLIALQISSLMSWLQHLVWTIIIQINTSLLVNWIFFRPRVSTNLCKTSFKFPGSKIWETVPLGLKCLPYYKLKKEWKYYLFIKQTWSYPYFACFFITNVIWVIFFSSFFCCHFSERDGVQLNSSWSFRHCPHMYIISF